MPEEVNEIMELVFDEETLEISVFIECLRVGRCSTSAFLMFQECCQEEGLNIEPVPGKGPFDFDFQLQAQRKEKQDA